MYLLDTDHISILQLASGSEYSDLAERMSELQLSVDDLAFSVVSFHEQVLGAHTFISRARGAGDVVRGYRLLGEILGGFSAAPVLPFDAAAAAVFDDLRGLRIRVATMDLRIAAIALSRGLVLVTRNVSDFGRVPGLITEKWTLLAQHHRTFTRPEVGFLSHLRSCLTLSALNHRPPFPDPRCAHSR